MDILFKHVKTRAGTSMSAAGLILTFHRLPKCFLLTPGSCSTPPTPQVVRERQVQSQCRRCSDPTARAYQCWSWASARRSAPRSAPALVRANARQSDSRYIHLWMCAHQDDVEIPVLLHSSMSSLIHYKDVTKHWHRWGMFVFPPWKCFQAAEKHILFWGVSLRKYANCCKISSLLYA